MKERLLRASRAGSGGGVIAFTAGHRGAGASTVAFEFAAALAPVLGRSVLLVDANLRDPSLHRSCSLSRTAGLVEVLAGEVDLSDAGRITGHGFTFLPAGRPHPAPSVLFGSERFRNLVGVFRSEYALTILDTAPLNAYVETAALAAALDGAVLVLEAERTRREVAQAARKQLETAQALLLGAVLNKRRQVIPDFIYRHL